MHFCYISTTIIISLSVVVSALVDFSDFTEPYDGSESLLFDPNTPLFDDGFSSSSSNTLAFLDQPTGSENPSSDIFWNDSTSFKLASCSTPSRVRRADDSSSCPDFTTSDDAAKITESLIQGRFSITCTLITGGLLPFALIPSAAPQDVIMNMNVLNPLATIGLSTRLYYPSTLYRATLGMSNFFLIFFLGGHSHPLPPISLRFNSIC